MVLEALFLFLVAILLFLGAIFLFFNYQSSKNHKETEEIINLEEEQEWFSQGRWLTDKEIDWATERIEKNEQFKILPAHQFHLVHEAKKWSKEEELFTYLLSELTDKTAELVFIPVNNPNFHWSLLVFETKTKFFFHYDTLHGANWRYAKPLCEELLKFLLDSWQGSEYHLKTKHDIRQGNGSDCGVAVIAIIERIREKYNGSMENIDLGKFDFQQERQELRKKYLTID